MAAMQWGNCEETHDSLGDWALQLGAMTGAGFGALTGGSLASANLATGFIGAPHAPAIFGTIGTVLGSVSCALAAKHLVLPLWAAVLGTPVNKRG